MIADVGFTTANNGGIIVYFKSNNGGWIVFYKPYLDLKIDLIILYIMGKRMKKWFR